MKYITSRIWILSLISLLTDTASEMLYPIMPIYLKTIGFSIVLVGILEGVAEAVAGLSKGYFGNISDQTRRRVPFVKIGYSLSAVSKPMMALFTYPLWIFFARTIDRLGKGIRTGARDAILSDEATPATKGKVFGFHRSIDTLGAVLGPAFAMLYLSFHQEDYKTLFLFAFFPGILAIGASFWLREKSSWRARSKAGLVLHRSGLLMRGKSPALMAMITTNAQDTATAIGTFAGFQSICAMLASSLTGFIWYNYGAPAAFIMTGVMTSFAIIYLLFAVKYSSPGTPTD